ncbi:TIGR03752 family integrating conjugative element protein [Pseudorhodoferax soli]|uniref:Integrating conjugative element protein (TIGR03752 family) n=1 Tax=Pseudorhodoferax soli TaxID=545864 RepID=A0A368XGR1_9BURK|nr:TIGR03752 family integrating conjugative element protein [Pseudorhodoferax soli]RCW66208.1 integrating conjugative element protein (TIGR03752 family) [Pseudorhodoferax soli]
MATTQNKLIPVLGLVAVAIVGTVAWKSATKPARTEAGPVMTSVPQAELPPTKGADRDTPQETLQTVIASNRELRESTEQVLKENKALRLELEDERRRRPPPPQQRMMTIGPDGIAVPAAGGRSNGTPAPSNTAGASPSDPASSGTSDSTADRGVVDVFSQAFDRASAAAGKVLDDQPGVFNFGGARAPGSTGGPTGSAGPVGIHGVPGSGGTAGQGTNAGQEQPWSTPAEGVVAYKVIPPMGYALQQTQPAGPNKVATGSYVRTTTPTASATPAPNGAATRAAGAANAAQAKAEPVPYFTIPENATLAGVVSMTSLIGRVPIDGRVTDPMQWKAVVGRDNLAANGFELPDDLAGMIVSGIAIGDMALSCTEGKVRSITFVFNDGTINTVSARRGGAGAGGAGGAARAATPVSGGTGGFAGAGDLGFISDLRGNPCVSGKFVTNAPAYLTDIVGMKTLEVAGQAYADAQRTVTQSGMFGATSSTITGSVGSYALGQAVAGASDEVSKWLMARLKSSFDAVVTPSGQRLVVHLDSEIRIDKQPQGRRLVHRQQSAALNARGAHHGLE